MVGVPGRSKGCHTCRKRKIACSLEKPYCMQCIKSNRVCAGYLRERIFIVNNFPTEASKGNIAKKSLAPVMALKRIEEAKYCPQNAYSGSDETRTSNMEVHWSVLQELSPSAPWRQQLMMTFLSSQIPEKMLGASEDKPWPMLLAELPSPSLALEKSTMAICTARLGRMNENEALLRKSLKLYTEGLQELQKALYDPCLMYKDETLGACMSLASYELMECPAGTRLAYASHHSGCARLVELRGAKAHTSGLGHQLFVSFRTQAILNSLENHATTYLSDKAWTTIPWKSTEKSSFDQLLDIMMVAPAIFRRADDFGSLDPQRRLVVALGVIEDCWKVDQNAHRFFQTLERSTSGLLYWPAVAKAITFSKSRASSPPDLELFPFSYEFPNLQIAKTMIFYWAVLNMLWTGMTRLYHLVSELQLAGFTACGVDQLPALGHRSDFMAPARNALQSVEFLMQEKMLGLGPQAVVAPVSIVVDTIKDFPHCAREVAWAQAVLDEIKERGLLFLGCNRPQR